MMVMAKWARQLRWMRSGNIYVAGKAAIGINVRMWILAARTAITSPGASVNSFW